MMLIVGLCSVLMIAFLLYCMCMKQSDDEDLPIDRKVVNATDESEMTNTSVTDYA